MAANAFLSLGAVDACRRAMPHCVTQVVWSAEWRESDGAIMRMYHCDSKTLIRTTTPAHLLVYILSFGEILRASVALDHFTRKGLRCVTMASPSCTGQGALRLLPSKAFASRKSIESLSLPDDLVQDRSTLKANEEVGFPVLKVTKVRNIFVACAYKLRNLLGHKMKCYLRG